MVKWLGKGGGAPVYNIQEEQNVQETEFTITNQLLLKIERSRQQIKREASGNIRVTFKPRPDITYRQYPDWLLSVLLSEEEPSGEIRLEDKKEKVSFGHLLIPGEHFIKFKRNKEQEGEKGKKKEGAIELTGNFQKIEENQRMIWEFPYEMDLGEILKTARSSKEIQRLEKKCGILEDNPPLSVTWERSSLGESIYQLQIKTKEQVLRKNLSTKNVPQITLNELKDIYDSLANFEDYQVLKIGVKNESAGTLLQSDVDVAEVKVKLPIKPLKISQIKIPTRFKNNMEIEYDSGEIDISGEGLGRQGAPIGLGEEKRVIFAIKEDLVSRMKGKDIEITVRGELTNFNDPVGAIIERSTNTMGEGLVYFTPLGYPIIKKENANELFPTRPATTGFPQSKLRLIVEYTRTIPTRYMIKEPYTHSFTLSEPVQELSTLIGRIEEPLESYGFTPLWKTDPREYGSTEAGAPTLGWSESVYKGVIKEETVPIRVEILSKSYETTPEFTGKTSSKKNRRKIKEENLIRAKVTFRTYTTPETASVISDLFSSIKNQLEVEG